MENFSEDLQNPDGVKISVTDEQGTIGDVLKLSGELSDVPSTGISKLVLNRVGLRTKIEWIVKEMKA